jgi:hypothetical protein
MAEDLRRQILEFLAVEPQTPAISRQIEFLQGELATLRGIYCESYIYIYIDTMIIMIN